MSEELALALTLEGRVDAARAETRRLVSLAGVLAKLPEPEIDPRFVAALEARLLTEGLEDAAPTQPRLTVVRAIPATPADEAVRRATVVQMPRRKHAVRRSFVAVAAAASLAAFPLAASASSLPGSPFHGVKRGIEQVRLAMFGTPLEDGFFHMELSHRRASELNQLIALGASADRIEEAAEMVESEMRIGQELIFKNSTGDLDLNRLATMARKTEAEMRKAREALGGAAAGLIAPAIETSERIQNAVRAALGLTIGDTVAGADGAILGRVEQVQPTRSSYEAADEGSSTKSTQDGDDADVAPTTPDDPTRGKDKPIHKVKDEGCEVAGSAQGLGAFLAPATKVTCN